MIADFIIMIHEARKPLAVQVKVHDSVAALRGACTRYAERTGRTEADYAETLGICHRFHAMEDPLCAVVRFAPPHTGAGMVAHEMGHAAVWLWEIYNDFEKKVLECANDEWFCWVLGELVRQTTIKFIEKGIY